MTTAAPTRYTPPTDGLQVGSGIDPKHGFYTLRYHTRDRSLVRHYDTGKLVVETPPPLMLARDLHWHRAIL
jgi:hypothetical protein